MTSPQFIRAVRDAAIGAGLVSFIRQRYAYLGYEWRTAPYDPNIFGVRNPDAEVHQDIFNDLIGMAYAEAGGNVKIALWEATTDPGKTHLQKPQFPEAVKNGTAILVPGQYKRVYELGIHGTGDWAHSALRQKGKLKIYRDANRDAVLDFNVPITEGVYGINVHRASALADPIHVGPWSAGCQVFAKKNQYNAFIQRVKLCAARGVSLFDYTLFTSDQILAP